MDTPICRKDLGDNQVLPLDHSRVFVACRRAKHQSLLDLKRDSLSRSLPEIGSSTNVPWLVWHQLSLPLERNQQIVVRELRGPEFISNGRAIALNSGTPPDRVRLQRRAPTPGVDRSVILGVGLSGELAAPGRRIELKGRCPWTCPLPLQ